MYVAGTVAECYIPDAGSRQHVDDGVCTAAEDTWEAPAEYQLLLQTQIPLHDQRRLGLQQPQTFTG